MASTLASLGDAWQTQPSMPRSMISRCALRVNDIEDQSLRSATATGRLALHPVMLSTHRRKRAVLLPTQESRLIWMFSGRACAQANLKRSLISKAKPCVDEAQTLKLAFKRFDADNDVSRISSLHVYDFSTFCCAPEAVTSPSRSHALSHVQLSNIRHGVRAS